MSYMNEEYCIPLQSDVCNTKSLNILTTCTINNIYLSILSRQEQTYIDCGVPAVETLATALD